MDADEFVRDLFDRIEIALKGTSAETLIKEEYTGKISNQIICQECGMFSLFFLNIVIGKNNSYKFQKATKVLKN